MFLQPIRATLTVSEGEIFPDQIPDEGTTVVIPSAAEEIAVFLIKFLRFIAIIFNLDL
jgi:hypothetical protein